MLGSNYCQVKKTNERKRKKQKKKNLLVTLIIHIHSKQSLGIANSPPATRVRISEYLNEGD